MYNSLNCVLKSTLLMTNVVPILSSLCIEVRLVVSIQDFVQKIPTRRQGEFERSLIKILRQKDISNAISEIIITTIISKLSEKFQYLL